MDMSAFIAKLFPNKMTFGAFLENLKPNDIFWISAQINQDQQKTLINKKFDFLTSKNRHQLRVFSSNNEYEIDLFLNEKYQTKNYIQQNSDFAALFNRKWDKIIEEQVEKIKDSLNNSNDTTSSASQAEIAENEKALEWIKVSFIVLEKAIKESLTNSDLLFQLQLFFGINPKTNLTEMRAIIFNLDIKFVILDNGLMRVIVYDDKNQLHGTTTRPSLSGDFSFRKREIFDEIIKILALLSLGIKFN